MPKSRQLAAIMFIDIVGYTALMQKDEAQTLSLRDKLKSKLESEVELRGGKVVKYMGDGALASFDSATEAVRVAVAVQKNAAEEPKIPLRIGIHQADVVFEDGDVYGDGVNIASRLESFALPGSIFISPKVYDDVKNHSDIEVVSLGKYSFKNVSEPMEIFCISNSGLVVPKGKKLQGKGVRYVSDKISFKKRALLFRFILIVAVLALLSYLIIPPILNNQRARAEIIPAIEEMVEENFRPPTEAFNLGLEAEKYIPEDSSLIKLWPVISTTISMVTYPPGADVYWKDYDKPQSDWTKAGTTPLTDVRFPRSYLRMEIRKNGYQTIQYAGPWPYGPLGPDIDTLKLDSVGSLPENMVRIPSNTASMYIVGLEQEGKKKVSEFLIDKYEVTNAEFKKFMDAGGYTDSTYWEHPFYLNSNEISFEEAVERFVDKTGRRGPANWEAGTYPNGQEDHPVTGVCWYEAAAYARYSKKQLPTIYHWSVVAQTSRTEFIVPLSNFGSSSTVPVGSKDGYSLFGIYDLAGNAREWCYNGSNITGNRYVLGGGWNDPTYAFNDSYTQPAMDRGVANGFRCIMELPGDTIPPELKKNVSPLFRDYKKEKPVNDETFALYLNQFKYDKNPLEPKIEESFDEEFWIRQKVTFDAGYNNERMQAWIYLPKSSEPPYQAIMYYPGSGDIYRKQYDPERIWSKDFVIKSGRVLVYPIYKGTNDRHDELNSDLPNESVMYKEHVVMWNKEFSRTIDYLETRDDIQVDKIGYLGWSWGGYMGGIIPAVEKRVKAVVLNVGGMVMNKSLPEVDQLNYLPRVKQPILMLSGKHDMFFPLETSQKPMFNFLGTSEKDKKRIVYEAGHLVPRTDFVKETLEWYDKYLGPVK
jgi:dienelactone hydrolase